MLLTDVVQHIAHYPIRNRGTFCGSLAHADPSSEWCLALMALDGEVVAKSTRGERVIAARDFFKGIMSTGLRDDELLVEARLPMLAAGTRCGFYEFSRRAGDFAMAAALGVYRVEGGKIVEPRLAVGGAEPNPRRIAEAEQALAGAAPGDQAFRAAAARRPPRSIRWRTIPPAPNSGAISCSPSPGGRWNGRRCRDRRPGGKTNQNSVDRAIGRRGWRIRRWSWAAANLSATSIFRISSHAHRAFRARPRPHPWCRHQRGAALPGVLAVWTAADIADVPPIDFREGRIPALEPYRQPVLATGMVRFVGDPVAAVFAADPYVAEDAADLITMDIEELPPVLDAQAEPSEFSPGHNSEAGGDPPGLWRCRCRVPRRPPHRRA